MKNVAVISLIACLFVSVAASAQRPLYKRAMSLIKKENKGTKLIITDRLTYINLSSFSEELSKEWKKGQLKVMDLLDSVDLVNSKYKSEVNTLKGIRLKGRIDTSMVYFSRVVDTFLLVEIIPWNRNFKPGYDNQAKYTRSTQYLFLFDYRQRIKKVLKHIVLYN